MKYKILTNWISILAILFVSLMPIVSHAFEESQSSDYQVICSSNGLKIISAITKIKIILSINLT